MFLGHYGLAFAAKRAAPRTSLGALTFAAEFLDELWPVLLLIGVEHVKIVPGLMAMSPLDFTDYPISHSLLMAIGWGAAIGGIYFLLKRYGRGAWVTGLLVTSHWFLDWPMHRADLPLYPGSGTRLGFGLWNSAIATYMIEIGLYAIGVAMYARTTRAKDRIGSWGLWVYVVALLGIFLSSNRAAPPTERALAWTTMGLWLFVLFAWLIDRHRYPVAPTGITPAAARKAV
ncbi:MAG TPA: hypothetical protein VM166_13865 [Gemmatimonadaceae bacterium]|nr:hypothetical protein [Gemmatimonadaceae bacterium]